MFDANLFYLKNGTQGIAEVYDLSEKSELYKLGLREKQHVLIRKPVDQPAPKRRESMPDMRIEVRIKGQWHPAYQRAPSEQEWLLLEASLPYAPQYIRAGEHPLDRFPVID